MRQAPNGPDGLPCLRKHEPIQTGLRRVLLACLGTARKALPAGQPRLRGEDIHQARVALKRARAVLRLGEGCGVRWAAPARRRLARQARELAAVRDAFVALEVAQRLTAKLPGGPRQGGHEHAAQQSAETGRALWPAWVRQLAAEQRRLSRRAWPVLTRRELGQALARSLRRLHKRQHAADGGCDAAALHEWRKAVIVMREQCNVLEPVLKRRQRGRASQLHRVARNLGVAHDLFMFSQTAQDPRSAAGSALLVARAEYERQRAIKRARRRWTKLGRVLRREFGAG